MTLWCLACVRARARVCVVGVCECARVCVVRFSSQNSLKIKRDICFREESLKSFNSLNAEYFLVLLLSSAYFFSKITFWSRSICSLKMVPWTYVLIACLFTINIQNSLLGATKLRFPFFSTFPPFISRWNTNGIISRTH